MLEEITDLVNKATKPLMDFIEEYWYLIIALPLLYGIYYLCHNVWGFM